MVSLVDLPHSVPFATDRRIEIPSANAERAFHFPSSATSLIAALKLRGPRTFPILTTKARAPTVVWMDRMGLKPGVRMVSLLVYSQPLV